MNRSFILATLLLGGITASAMAETITTLRGRTYQGCRIKQVHPDGVSFTHRDGAAKILFTDLPSSMRSKYGYDPKKAAAYSKKVEEERKEAAKRREDYLRREAEAIEAAQFMNAMRTVQAQNNLILSQVNGGPSWVTGFASVPVAGYYNGLQGWPVTTPITGPVVHGRHYRQRLSWDSVGIAPLVPGSGGIYVPPSGGFAFYPPVWPSLGYARPGYGIHGSWNVGGGVRVGVGLGTVPFSAPPAGGVVPGVSVRGSAVIPMPR
ncbi:MAG: hypothetical protein HS117_17510 [Verrucomicrobiaceae bacterium]|jgi:hypothetical protein|nr:hypothetical protein [Verrucomicrobiaceae bacterium]